MSLPDDSRLPFSLLQFYDTAPYPCSYLAEERAISRVATPTHLITNEIYGELVRRGFRRSGVFTYRPACPNCQACVPVRLPVDRLNLTRSQRRCLNTHRTLVAREMPLRYAEAHYRLYQRYQTKRHAGGGMDQDSHEQYAHFLLQSRVDTRLVEFREGDELRMVSIVDVLSDGLSSVYTFYDPDIPGSGFGTYSILWQAGQCVRHGLPYLYLGYWIRDCQKMAYKARFRPLEGYFDDDWREFEPSDPRHLSRGSR